MRILLLWGDRPSRYQDRPLSCLPVLRVHRNVPSDRRMLARGRQLGEPIAANLAGCNEVLVLLGNDPTTGFTAALAGLGNIGPGFEAVGPMGNFGAFSDLEKIILTVSMWLGRLEIMTVLALLHPHVWRTLRLSRT